MYSDYKLVQQCLRVIEEQLGWGDAAQWHNDVYLELSEKIHKRTQVLLSPTTLKRVWGRVNYSSAPSITTLNTLSRFAGYQNWRDFKNKAGKKKPSKLAQKISSNLGVIMLSASLMTIVFISFYSLRGVQNNPPVDASKVSFSSKPITKGLPNSVVFDVDLEEVKSDSIHIQQYWDETKTILLKPGQKQATGLYYYPGYYRAKLLVDGKIIKEHDLFIKSEGWLGTLDYTPVPKYFSEKNVLHSDMSFSPSVIKILDQSKEPLQTAFHLVDDFGKASGDNFRFQTTVKSIYNDKWAVCQKMAILILGTKSALIVSFSIPGCVSDLGLMLSNVYLSGKEHDLSGLGIEFFDYRDLKIEVVDKKLTVYAEDSELISESFTETIGEIVGIRYRFLGAGSVAKVKLTDLNEETVFLDNDFTTMD